MSVYNGEEYLREAIDSILNQTFGDFEFLIINDGSTDSTAEILQSCQDPRIRIINNEKNIGLTKSLNKGLKLAKGEYVARMDADDISMPGRLQKQVEMLEQKLNLGIVGTRDCVIDEKGNIKSEARNYGNPLILRWKLLFNNVFTHSSVMMRKKAYEDSGGYNPEFEASQDYDLWSRIVKKWQIGLVPQILCHWRKRAKHSITIEKNKTQKAAAGQISVRNVSELTNRQLLQKQCIDLHNFINGYYFPDRVSQLREVLHSLRIARKDFEKNFISDRSVRCQINNLIVANLCGSVYRSNTFHQRVLICAYALWFGGWKSARKVFLTFAGFFLPDNIKKVGKAFLRY